jgi:hypothetical protein
VDLQRKRSIRRQLDARLVEAAGEFACFSWR